MASWQDGPEYAPTARPDAFAAPGAVAVLTAPPPVASLAAGAPPVAPDAYRAPDAPALPQLVVPAKDQRDPAEPYDIAVAALTEGTSAWSATHSAPRGPGASDPLGAPAPVGESTPTAQFDPGRPIATSIGAPSAAQPPAPAAAPPGFPQAGTAGWFGPATTVPARASEGVTPQAWVRAITPVVLGALVVGIVAAVLGPLALLGPLAYLAGAVAARVGIRLRRGFVNAVFSLGVGFLVIMGAAMYMLDQATIPTVVSGVAGLASLASLITLLLVGVSLSSALKNGERPR